MYSTEPIRLSSQKKWFWIGMFIAFIQPVFAGLILGIALWTEGSMRKQGQIITWFSVIWTVITAVVLRALSVQ